MNLAKPFGKNRDRDSFATSWLDLGWR